MIKKLLSTATLACSAAILVACGGGSSSSQASNAPTWNIASDFSLSNNPNGQWQYGLASTAGGTITLFLRKQEAQEPISTGGSIEGWAGENKQDLNYFPFIRKFNGTAGTDVSILTNGTPVITQKAGGIVMHPWHTSYAVAQWTANSSGKYEISAKFYSAQVYPDTTATTEVGVYKNGTELFKDDLDTLKKITEWSTDKNYIDIQAGDIINVYVGPGNSNMTEDSTGVDFSISKIN